MEKPLPVNWKKLLSQKLIEIEIISKDAAGEIKINFSNGAVSDLKKTIYYR